MKKVLLIYIALFTMGCTPSPGEFCNGGNENKCLEFNFETGVANTISGLSFRWQFIKTREKCDYFLSTDNNDICANVKSDDEVIVEWTPHVGCELSQINLCVHGFQSWKRKKK